MTDKLDTAAGQAEADKAVTDGWLSPSALVDAALDLHGDKWVARIEAEATARRYGGRCILCGIIRDYHPGAFGTEAEHPFTPHHTSRKA